MRGWHVIFPKLMVAISCVDWTICTGRVMGGVAVVCSVYTTTTYDDVVKIHNILLLLEREARPVYGINQYPYSHYKNTLSPSVSTSV